MRIKWSLIEITSLKDDDDDDDCDDDGDDDDRGDIMINQDRSWLIMTNHD